MAVPGFVLSSASTPYPHIWYEYIIDGKVYRFELNK